MKTGGAEKLLVDLLPGLKQEGHDVDLLLFDGTDTPLRRQIEQAGIRVYDLGKGGSVYSPKNLFRLVPYLRRYDVVHTHNTAPQLFAAIGSFFCKSKLITTEHNTNNRRRAWKWYAYIDRWMYNRYRRVVCISEKTLNNLLDFIKRTKAETIVIHNGIKVADYASATSSQVLEADAPGSRKLLMVAGFRWEKDQPTVIKALKHLSSDFHLFLVGDGVRRSEFEDFVKKTGLENRVHFMGLRTDVPQLLKAADYIIMSSHFEGLSLSSVEGLACGRPMLASDVDGLREVVGGAGILFRHENAEALAEEIMRLENNPDAYAEVSEKGFQRARQFDISHTIKGYSSVLENL